jgi:hypothetical protein
MLCVHYKLQSGEPLPRIAFSSDHARRHRFGKAPYLFQYNRQPLLVISATSEPILGPGASNQRDE